MMHRQTDNLSRAAGELLESLSYPQFLPEDFAQPELIETHLSLIIIGGKRVLKFRKPLEFPFCDHRTLDSRWQAAVNEVVLNRRLSSGVYLGLAGVIDGEIGEIIAEPAEEMPRPRGEPVVIMNRLPEEEQLSEKAVRGSKSLAADIERVALRLAEFHRSGAGVPSTDAVFAAGYAQNLAKVIDDNFAAIAGDTAFLLSPSSHQALALIHDFSEKTAAATLGESTDRAKRGLVVEGHGDIRAEHVFIRDGVPEVIDCLEFSLDLRTVDCLNDLAFLCMDLDALGRRDLAAALEKHYLQAFPQAQGSRELWRLFCSYRAMVRAKVGLYAQLLKITADEQPSDSAEHYPPSPQRLIAVAGSYALNLTEPLLLLIGGTMGCGKSTLAAHLSGLFAARVVQSDRVRKELLGSSPEDRRLAFGTGKYSAEATAQTYGALLDKAEDLLGKGNSVILDASFSDPSNRNRAYDLAQRLGAKAYFVHCTLSPHLQRERLAARAGDTSEISDGRLELLAEQESHFQAAAAHEPLIICDNGGSPVESAVQVLAELRKD